MKFRFGLIVGLAAGYVFGTRAGYERYQEIQSKWRQVRTSEPAQRLSSEVRDLADRAGTRIEQTADRGADELGATLNSSSSSSASGTSGETSRTPVEDPRY